MEQTLPMTPVKCVQRYDGRDLGCDPHIAVLGSSKVGNFVVTIPLLRLLRQKYPNARIDFWGTEATRDFEIALCGDGQLLNWRISWDKPEKHNGQIGKLQAITEAAAERKRDSGDASKDSSSRRDLAGGRTYYESPRAKGKKQVNEK